MANQGRSAKREMVTAENAFSGRRIALLLGLAIIAALAVVIIMGVNREASSGGRETAAGQHIATSVTGPATPDQREAQRGSAAPADKEGYITWSNWYRTRDQIKIAAARAGWLMRNGR